MNRTPALLIAAVLAGSVAAACLPATVADAAPVTTSHRGIYGHDNVLRHYCPTTDSRSKSCVSFTSDDIRQIWFRDSRGHQTKIRTQVALWRYLATHSHPCKDEDSPSCYWRADFTGNGAGDSFIDIGRKAYWYVEDIAS